MKRIDALEVLLKHRADEPLIVSVGYQPSELNSLGHSDLNLYQVNFPYPSPLGLGLALAIPHQKVIVSDGDGSAVAGMSTLCTIANAAPPNLIHIVWDNESWMTCGKIRDGHLGPMPTPTAGRCDFEQLARGAGIEHAYTVRDERGFEDVLVRALGDNKPYVIVAKVDTSTPVAAPVPYGMTENAIRFRRALVDKGWVDPMHAGASTYKDVGFDFGAGADKGGVEAIYRNLREVVPREPGNLSLDHARAIYEGVKAAGIDMFVYLPDSSNYLVQRFAADDPAMLSISVTREDEGMAIAMGGFMGGKTSCIMMEASGLGMSYLALAWLGIQQRMATLILTSHTDGLGEYTDYHVVTRYLAEPLLRGMGIPHHTLMDVSDARRMLRYATMTVRGHVFPVVIQLPRQVLWHDPE